MEQPSYLSQRSAEPVRKGQSRLSQSRLRAIWQRNQDLLRNAGSLLATTGVTSAFGFAFWIFAARVFSQQSVGFGSAAVSMVNLLGTIGMFGLGTMLIGELPQRRSKGRLVAAALSASAIGSLVLGLGFALVSLAFGKHFVEINGTLPRIAVFSCGVALTGATLVFDESTIGLLRGGIQLARNTVFSIAKMAVLPLTAIVVHSAFGVGILFSWILGTLISLVPVVILLRRSGSSILHRPDWRALRSLARVTMAHNWLNLAIAAPPQFIPVLVTIVVSPSANAAYYVAFMIVSFLYMIPVHLSTVLFAIASATPEAIAEKLRFVLRLSTIIGITGMIVLGAGAHLILGIFGASYAREATVPMWLLLLGFLPTIPKSQYIAVCRATGRVSRASVILLVQSAVELLSVCVGGKLDGLIGVCLGLLIVGFAEGLMTAPTVFRAAAGRLQLEVLDESVEAGAATSPEWVPVTMPQPVISPEFDRAFDYGRRQHAGLAALVAIATSVAPQNRAYDLITGSFPAIRETGSFPAVPAAAAPGTPQSRLGRPGTGPHGTLRPGARRGRHRRTGSFARLTGPFQAVGDQTATDMPAVSADETAYRLRQEAGVAALMAIARRPAQF
ncbi:MAG TPA: lipopolysaccharide biosynthesis protein [Trebonia sp.]|nr:lipopolysaccharide biosynthesis protein [Trebonia sp.]